MCYVVYFYFVITRLMLVNYFYFRFYLILEKDSHLLDGDTAAGNSCVCYVTS